VDGTAGEMVEGIRIGFASANESELARITLGLRRSLPVSGLMHLAQENMRGDGIQVLRTA